MLKGKEISSKQFAKVRLWRVPLRPACWHLLQGIMWSPLWPANTWKPHVTSAGPETENVAIWLMVKLEMFRSFGPFWLWRSNLQSVSKCPFLAATGDDWCHCVTVSRSISVPQFSLSEANLGATCSFSDSGLRRFTRGWCRRFGIGLWLGMVGVIWVPIWSKIPTKKKHRVSIDAFSGLMKMKLLQISVNMQDDSIQTHMALSLSANIAGLVVCARGMSSGHHRGRVKTFVRQRRRGILIGFEVAPIVGSQTCS